MKKILLSLGMIVFVGAAVAGATGAFFTDTETSTGNVFTAGSLDLKVDSECHYYQNGVDIGCEENDLDGASGYQNGNWEETDLGAHKFFLFNDIKPGDRGENTISLHVYDNDAWGRILMTLDNNFDNSCTEPEEGTNGEGCTVETPENQDENSGELLGAMLGGFKMWLDEGSTPGFQNIDAEGNPIDGDENTSGVIEPVDPTEGDNIWQDYEGSKWDLTDNLDLRSILSGAYSTNNCSNASPDGHNGYDRCHGLAEDGRMVGSTTYYLGLEWELPLLTENEVQTDSLGGTIEFQVEQHRNNPNPWN